MIIKVDTKYGRLFQVRLTCHEFLNEEQLKFIEQVGSILEKYAPQFDPAETILTKEGKDLIILILRNRKLSNISLVIYYGRSVGISWAQVNTLNYHDDLDLGCHETRFCDFEYDDDTRL